MSAAVLGKIHRTRRCLFDHLVHLVVCELVYRAEHFPQQNAIQSQKCNSGNSRTMCCGCFEDLRNIHLVPFSLSSFPLFLLFLPSSLPSLSSFLPFIFQSQELRTRKDKMFMADLGPKLVAERSFCETAALFI